MFAFPTVPERSTLTWLSLGWIPLVLVGVYIFFSAAMTAFVGIPQEIAILSVYSCIACSLRTILAIADKASS
jgi:hypothetical protein